MLLNCGIGEDSWESLGLQGDQSWVFIGRTDVEAETPILWLPHAKSWLIWKDPDAGKDWGQEKGRQRMRCWMVSPTQWTGVWVDSGSWWWTGRPGMPYGVAKSRIRLRDWTELGVVKLFTTTVVKLFHYACFIIIIVTAIGLFITTYYNCHFVSVSLDVQLSPHSVLPQYLEWYLTTRHRINMQKWNNQQLNKKVNKTDTHVTESLHMQALC